MQLRARLGRRKGTIASAAALAIAAGAFVVLAFSSEGYPLNKVDLNDGSVWVTNNDLGALGRFNAPIGQLDSDLIANHGSQPDIDVLQQAGTVFLVDHSANTLRHVDIANVVLSDDTVDLPPNAEVAFGGQTVAIADPSTGKMWVRSTAAIMSLSLANTKPTTVAGTHPAIAVATDGTAYAFVPGTGLLVTITGAAGAKPAARSHRTALSGTSAQITTVGNQPVVLVGGRLLLPGGTIVAVPSPAGAVLQQSGADSADVFVATNTSLLRVDLESGAVQSLYSGGGGSPAAPVSVSDCVYAAWGGNAAYLRRCAGAPDEAPRPLQGLPSSPNLVFRVNRNVVVLNEVAIGAVYVYSRGGADLGNWQSLTPKKQTTKASKKQKQQQTDKQNHPPTARPDSYGARPGATSTLHVLDNDGDPDGDVLIIQSVSGLPATAGRVAIVANGQAIQFTALVTWTTTATFTYRINDGDGGTDSAKVTLTSRPSGSNRLPAALPHAAGATDAVGGTVSDNVLDSWRDPDGDPLTLIDASTKAPDTVQFTADGKVTFTDVNPATGTRTVAIKVSDGAAQPVNGTLTVKVVTPSKGAIGADDDRVTGVVGQAISIHPLDNDTDPNTTVPTSDQQLRLLNVTAAPAGTTVTPDYDTNTIRFVAQRAESYYVTYHATDGAQTGSARIRVDVITPSTANPPVAVADRAVVRGTTSTNVDVLANDIDPSGNMLVVAGVSVPTNAGMTATVIAHRWVRVTPTEEGSGTVTLHYTVSDGGGSDTGSINVTQLRSSALNQPPITHDDTATVRAGDVTTINVLANDSDPEGEPLTLVPTITTDSATGTWAISGQTIRFLAPTKAGTAVAHYSVQDPEGAETSAKVTVTIVAPDAATNQPPQPPTVEARVFAGTSVRIPIPLSGVDPDGDSVVLLGPTDSPTLGRITGQGAGYLVYQAYADSSGTDALTYRLQDPYGARGTGTIRVGVIAKPAQDTAPAAVDDTYTVAPGATVNVPVLVNDSDIDGDPLTVEALKPLNPNLSRGTALSGSVITIHAGSHDGDQVKVRYGLSDGRGQRAEATVTITSAKGAKVPPVALDDLAPAVPASAGTVTVDVLANDYDVDGGAGDLTLKALDSTSKHPSTVTPKGLVIALTPEPRLVPYEITDSDGQTAMAFVQVPGTGTNLPRRNPAAPGLQVKAGGTVTVSLAAQITDPSGLPVRLTDAADISTSPTPGLALAPSGLTATTLVLHATGQYAGPASLVVQVTDAPSSGTEAADVTARSTSITLPVTVLPPATATPIFACPTAHPQAGGIPVIVDLATCVSGITPSAASRLSFSTPSGVATGVSAHLSGTVMTITAGAKARTGAQSTMSFTVTDGAGRHGPARLGVEVSPAPLAKPGNDSQDMNAGSTVRLNVTGNDENPFPATPLHLIAVDASAGGVRARVASSSDVELTAAASFHGSVTLAYTVGDATNDAARQTHGEILVNVVGRPGAPGVPVEQSVGDGYAVVSWSAAVTNGAPITTYTVTGSPSYSHTCADTVCKLTGLTNGGKYTFRVQAVNKVGTGVAGGVSAVMEPDVVPDQPSPPVTTFGNASMTLDWAPAHSSGSVVKCYVVQISPGNAQSSCMTARHLVWSGLTNGTSYTFRVEAFNDSPHPSTWSVFSAPDIPATVPGQPTAPSAAGVDDGIGKQMTVTWGAPATNGAPITAYHLSVYRAGALTETVAEDGDTNGATVSVDNGVQYTFRVTATNKAGVSTQSAASAASVAHGKPAVVTSLSVNDHSGSAGYDHAIAYSLSAPNDNGMAISTYQFSYDGSSVDATSSSTSGQIGGLTNGTSYQFRVRACNDMCGDWSAASATVTPYGPVPTPNAGASQSGARQIQVSWSSGGTNGRPIDHLEINVDNNGWENVGTSGNRTVGNGPNQTHSIQVRAVDTAGQTSGVASASATTAPSTVGVSKGVEQAHTGCVDPCYYIHITLNNFASSSSVTCSFDSQKGGGFFNATVNTDGSGNYSGDVDDWYGFNGTWVQATCNGVTGRDDSW